MQSFSLTLALFVLTIGTAPEVLARTETASTTLWGQGSMTHFWYREFNPSADDIIDQEYGWLPGLGLKLEMTRGDLFYEGSVQFEYQKLPYDGHTQSGIPATTSTNETIWDLNGRMGRWIRPGVKQTAIYAGLGYRQWLREILSSSAQGLTETYSFTYALVGFKTRLYDGSAGNLYFDFHIIHPLDAEMDVHPFSVQDASSNIVRTRKTTLNLGEKRGFYIALPFTMDTGRRLVRFEPFYEYTQFGISPAEIVRDSSGNVIMVSVGAGSAPLAVLEPESETEKYGLKISFTF